MCTKNYEGIRKRISASGARGKTQLLWERSQEKATAQGRASMKNREQVEKRRKEMR